MPKAKRKRGTKRISGCATLLLISMCLCTASIFSSGIPTSTATKQGSTKANEIFYENLSSDTKSKQSVTIKTNTLNVRAGPGTGYSSLGQLKKGDKVSAIGRSADSKWFVIKYSGKNGWISSSPDLVESDEDIQILKVIEAPIYQVKVTAPPSNNATLIPPTIAPPVNACPGFNYTCSALTCAQAYACLAAGNGSLDRDNDGIPCEAQCK